MKKKILLGSLILSSLIYAENVGEEISNKVVEKLYSKNSWTLKGSEIKYEIELLNSETEEMESGKSAELKLKLKKELDKDTTMYLGWETEKGEEDFDNDNNVELLLNRKFMKKLEAQMEFNVNMEDGMSIEEVLDSDETFIKYNFGDIGVSFYPYSMNMNLGDEFETNDFVESKVVLNELLEGTVNAPGIFTEYHVDKNFRVGFGIGTVGVDDKDNKDVSRFAYILEGEYSAKKVESKLKISGNTEKEDDEDVAILSSGASLMSSLDLGRIELKNEILITNINKGSNQIGYNGEEISGSDYAFYLKGEYKAFENKDLKVLPYIEYKYVGEYVYFDDDESYFEDGYHGGLSLINLGVEFDLDGGLIIDPSLEFGKSGHKGYYEDSDGNIKDSMYKFGLEAKYKFK